MGYVDGGDVGFDGGDGADVIGASALHGMIAWFVGVAQGFIYGLD